MMNEAKRHLKKAGLSNEQITSEILTYQKSRATAIVTTATKYGYDTIVVGRRGLTCLLYTSPSPRDKRPHLVFRLVVV